MATVRGDTNATLKDLTLIAENTIAEVRPKLHPLIASQKSEDGAYTKIPIAANIGFPVKFEGERKIMGKDVTVAQTFNQDTYELTIELDADLVMNAKAWDMSDIVAEASMAAALFRDYTMSQVVIQGSSKVAYDGVNFYGTTHKYAKAGSNTINNTVSKSGASVPQLITDFSAALVKLRTFLDNQGRLLNPTAAQGQNELVVHCPVALQQPFLQMINGSMVPITVPVTSSGTTAVPVATNTLLGAANIFADGYLDVDSPTTWYLHYVGRPQRPFVLLENYPLRVDVLGFNSEHCIKTNKVMIAMKERFVIGYYRFDRSVKVA